MAERTGALMQIECDRDLRRPQKSFDDRAQGPVRGIRGKPPDERLRVRQEKSKPLLATFESTIKAKLATLSKKAALTAAINYSLNHWAALTFYCEDGRAEISNALAENALRCVAFRRKTICSSAPRAVANVLRRCTA
ncbi:transposase IS66 [Caballeronia choica]|jgi:Transposase IS66 family|uniref:Transposase IS66 n=1 Tax=Caballeronia choica TaxID=326476 RepID=A0A158L3A3_9BURK|nr:transposase IS66 [Caballeronia choica]